jgi:hypothetical protein
MLLRKAAARTAGHPQQQQLAAGVHRAEPLLQEQQEQQIQQTQQQRQVQLQQWPRA